MNDAECSMKVPGVVKTLVNAVGLNLECARVLHVGILLLVLIYSNETLVRSKRYSSVSSDR